MCLNCITAKWLYLYNHWLGVGPNNAWCTLKFICWNPNAPHALWQAWRGGALGRLARLKGKICMNRIGALKKDPESAQPSLCQTRIQEINSEQPGRGSAIEPDWASTLTSVTQHQKQWKACHYKDPVYGIFAIDAHTNKETLLSKVSKRPKGIVPCHYY